MSAKDIFHNTVRIALEKENWKITNDPYQVKIGGVEMRIDLGVERMIAAERDSEKIAVEIKNFLNYSKIHDFHEALGQYINYKFALAKQEPERLLLLAIPDDVYSDFFGKEFIQEITKAMNVNLLIFNDDNQIITKWIK